MNSYLDFDAVTASRTSSNYIHGEIWINPSCTAQLVEIYLSESDTGAQLNLNDNDLNEAVTIRVGPYCGVVFLRI